MNPSLTNLERLLLAFLMSKSDLPALKTAYIKDECNKLLPKPLPVSSYHSCLVRLADNKGFIKKSTDLIKPEGWKTNNWKFKILSKGRQALEDDLEFSDTVIKHLLEEESPTQEIWE